jgi:hypothetical protein
VNNELWTTVSTWLPHAAFLAGLGFTFYLYVFRKWRTAKIKRANELLAVSEAIAKSNNGGSSQLSRLFEAMAIGDTRRVQNIVEQIADGNFQTGAERSLAEANQLLALRQLSAGQQLSNTAQSRGLGIDFQTELRRIAEEEQARGRIRAAFAEEMVGQPIAELQLYCSNCGVRAARTIYGMCRACFATSDYVGEFTTEQVRRHFETPLVDSHHRHIERPNRPGPPIPVPVERRFPYSREYCAHIQVDGFMCQGCGIDMAEVRTYQRRPPRQHVHVFAGGVPDALCGLCGISRQAAATTNDPARSEPVPPASRKLHPNFKVVSLGREPRRILLEE